DAPPRAAASDAAAEPAATRDPRRRDAVDDEIEAVRSHPKVQAVLEIFATDIESVETLEGADDD
ncbi:MAG TPA: hypothetical protein VMV46_15995, partial [Thermoanaerobaculia bacterium]|nr:hypothetical protein [Thermoanaerobaculia bacterium]